MDYGELKALIAETAHRSDLTAQIPTFISQAEGFIARTCRAAEMETSYTLTDADRGASGKLPSYSLPDNFLWPRYVLYKPVPGEVSSFALEPISSSSVGYWSNQTGRPQVYYILQQDIIGIWPVAPKTTETSLGYYGRLPALTLDTDTNDLLTTSPNLYLYGALKYLAAYIQDIEMQQLYTGLVEASMIEVNELGDQNRNVGPARIFGASKWV